MAECPGLLFEMWCRLCTGRCCCCGILREVRNKGWWCLRIGWWRRYLELRGRTCQEPGENSIMRCCLIYTRRQLLSGLFNTRKWEEWGMWHIWGWREIHTGFWWGKVKEGITCMGRIIWSCGGMLWTRLWIFGSHRMWRISCLHEEHLASQKDSAPRDWL
jgi:hypothetical protein